MRQVLRAIIADVCSLGSEWTAKNNLPQGYAGVALFLAYASRAERDDDLAAVALRMLRRATNIESPIDTTLGLFTGFLGVAWVLEQVRGSIVHPGEDVGLDDIDHSLAASLHRAAQGSQEPRHEYDLISGLVGVGVYALERMPRPNAQATLVAIVELLRRMSEETASGTTWLTPPELLTADDRTDFPEGYYNCGVAHGVPGVIGFLSRVQAAGLCLDSTEPLLHGAVEWLLSQENPAGRRTQFPIATHPSVVGKEHWDNSRLAWCYGDPGIAAVLLAAAIAAENRRWEKQAVSIARNSAQVRVNGPVNLDGSICHGTAGLIHIFNTFYQHTKDKVFLDSLRYWLRLTLDLRREGRGIAGFQAWAPGSDGKPEWLTDPGFLTGASGIGLALCAVLSKVPPEWGRGLLLPLPGQS